MRPFARLLVVAVAAAVLSGCAAKVERYPTSADYPPGTMARSAVQAAGHP